MAKKPVSEIIPATPETPTVPLTRVEVMELKETDLIPREKEDFLKELPTDRNDCFRILVADVSYAQKQNALRMWHIGKIIHTLNERGEEHVMEEAMGLTGYKERQLYTCVQAFKEFPDPTHISNIGKRITWSAVKSLMKVRKKDNREALCDRIMAGEITDENIDTAVKATVAEERKEKQDTDGKAPVGPPSKKLNPNNSLSKIDTYILESVKKLQQFEVEIAEIFKYVWNRELVPDEDTFDKAVEGYNVLKGSAEKLQATVGRFITATQKTVDTDPHKK